MKSPYYFAIFVFQQMVFIQALNVKIHCRLTDFSQQCDITVPLSTTSSFDMRTVDHVCREVQKIWSKDKVTNFVPASDLVGVLISEGMYLDFLTADDNSDNEIGIVAGEIRSRRREKMKMMDFMENFEQFRKQTDKKFQDFTIQAQADKKDVENLKIQVQKDVEDLKIQAQVDNKEIQKRFEVLFFADAERDICKVFDVIYKSMMVTLKTMDSDKYKNYTSLSSVLSDSNHNKTDLVQAFSAVANINHAVATRTWETVKMIKQTRNRYQHAKIRNKKVALESLDDFFMRWTTTATSQSDKDELKTVLERFIDTSFK